MKEILQKYILILRKDRTRRKKLLGVLCTLSVIVMLAVAWQLRFVGIAQTDVPSCGMEEHEHTAECIERRLICELQEGQPEPDAQNETQEPVVHHHSDACYEEVKTLHCEQPEHVHTDECYEIIKTMDCLKEEHTHDSSCYETQKELICTEDHEHTDACYEEKQVLICPKEEHTHNDEECYKVEKVLKCQQTEHSHSDECYTVEQKLICGKEEGQVEETFTVDEETGEQTGGPKLHVHTDECYQDVYVCGKTAHKHTLDCYSDPKADVETYEDWEKTLPKKPGRTWNESMLQVAQSQMDYKESIKNFKAADDGQRKQGYTRYGEWYGNPYGDWNTMFVSFCLRYSGISEEAVPRHSGAFAMSVKLKDMELLEGPEYEPKPGDVVFFQDDPEGNISRSAIVASLGNMIVDDEKVPCITIIEGDRNDAVSPYKYALDDEVVAGYLSMDKAYKRAVDLKIPPEPLPDQDETVETEPTTEPTEAPTIDFTPEEQNDELAQMLYKFNAKAVSYTAAVKAEDEAAAKTARVGMEQIYKAMEARHAELNPEAAEDDFEFYMEDNASSYYNVYLEALAKYPEVEQSVPGETTDTTVPGETTDGTVPGETTEETVPDETEGSAPQETEPQKPKQEPLKAETVKLLDAMATKATEYQYAVQAEDNKKIRSLSEDMNLLYDQAKVLYYSQYPQAAETDFDTYLNKQYAKSVEMMADAEKRVGTRALDALLKSKLETFSQKAEVCAKAMNIGENAQAKELKLDMDQLYIEMQNLHAKRYPDAAEGSFDIYLNNNAAKAVKRYLSAVEAFTEVKLENYITYTDPVSGEARRIFRLEDGMQVDVLVSGSICFPVQQQAEKPLDARETTVNLETVASDGAILNSTQAAAQGTTTAATIETVETEETSAAADETTENPESGIMLAAVNSDTTEGTTAPDETTEGTTAPDETTEGTTDPDETTEGTTAPVETTEGTTAPDETTEGTTAPVETTEGTTVPNETTDSVTEGTTAATEASEPEENEIPAEDNRWNRINLDVVPVSEDAELAFAQYIGEHYPDATGMTMMDLKYQYNGMDLDVGDANVSVVMTPGKKAPAPAPRMMMFMAEPQQAAPTILNAPVVESMSPAMAAAEERAQEDQKKNTAASEEPTVVMTVLERKADGVIEPVTQATLDRNNGQIPNLKLRANKGSTYATLNTPAESKKDAKPIENHKQWPDAWGGDIKTSDGLVDFDGNKIQDANGNKDFMLRTDPYFNNGTGHAHPSEADFPKPEAKLGYILGNYNFFIFDDVVAKNHLVGTLAIKGNSYLRQNPGGTGSGYICVGNGAPSYFEGRIVKANITEIDNPYNLTPYQNSGKVKIVNPDTPQLQAMWLHDTCKRIPTYLGDLNKAGATIQVKDINTDQSESVTFKTPAIDTAAQSDPENGSVVVGSESPFYYAQGYIKFDDFYHQMMDNNAATISPVTGINIKRPGVNDDISKKEQCVESLMNNGYGWYKANNMKYTKLFIKMGSVYTLEKNVDGIMICYMPWDGFEGYANDKDYAQFLIDNDDADDIFSKANYLATRNVRTVTHFTGDKVILTGVGDGYGEGSFTYYTKDPTKDEFDPDSVTNADIVNTTNYKSGAVTLMPKAKEVFVRKSATHVVAPDATVYAGNGPYFGCFVCHRLYSVADHHVLPFESGVKGKPIVFPLSKMIKENGKDLRAPHVEIKDGSGNVTQKAETFSFTITPYAFYKQLATDNEVMKWEQTPTKFSGSAFPQLAFPEYQTALNAVESISLQNVGSKIVMDDGLKKINNYFKQLVACVGANFGDYKGLYCFKVTENEPTQEGFTRDPRVSYICIPVSHDIAYGKYTQANLNTHGLWASSKPLYYDLVEGTWEQRSSIVFVNELNSGYTGPELPKSGGAGTHIFTITGFALMMIPVILVSARKKRGA